MCKLRFEDFAYNKQRDLFELDKRDKTYFDNDIKKLKSMVSYLNDKYYEIK